jgi:hypothetical protein
MKKVICGLLLGIIVFLVIFGIAYGAFSFYYLDFNLANWSEEARGVTTLFGIVLGAVMGVVISIAYIVHS